MADIKRHDRRPAAGPAPASTPEPRVPRWLGVAMLAEAVTLGIASYLHRDGRIPLGFTVIHGENFRGASLPEAVIGAVLAIGAAVVLAAPRRARAVALGTTGFAVLGVIVGVIEVVSSSRPSITIDLAYHSALLAALVVTLVLLVLHPARPRVAGRQ
jgi:heme A synthase